MATLGTATTSEHVQKLLRASHKVVFSYDGDSAGRKAAWRALQACLPMMRDDVSIRFLFLPAEHDPDSYIRAYGDKAFRASMDEAVSLSRFMLDELSARHRLDEAEGRAACVHEAIPLIAAVPENAYRLQLEREIAQLVRFTPEELGRLLDQARAAATQAPTHVALDAGRQPPSRPFDTQVSDAPPWDEAPVWDEPQVSGGGTGRRLKAGRAGARAPGLRNEPSTRHSVTPMAKQLLRLLNAHPRLVAGLGDQQLEILERGPHLKLVRDLIALAAASGARHAGALLQAAEPDSDLEQVLSGLGPQVLAEEDLPDPQAEWNDALRRIELDMIKNEQTALAQAGLTSAADQQRYQDLNRRRILLESGGARKLL